MSNAKQQQQQQQEKMKLAPIRPLADFVLDTKRYLPPTFNDLKRFNNRVVSNLLYYQTNYFIVSASIFLLFLLFSFNKMFGGAFGIGVAAAAALFTLDKIPQLKAIKRQYPVALYAAWGLALIVVYSTFRPIISFLLVVLIPIIFWILHASMRSRGIKNKINNKMEQLGASVYTNSPMGFLLVSLGFEAKDYED